MGFDSPHQQFYQIHVKYSLEAYDEMNSENQKIIISIFGLCLIISIIGVVCSILFSVGIESITLLLGVVTTIIGVLATFLKDKNLSEKESETLEKYFIQNAVKDAEDESIENIIEESESGENAIQ